MKRKPTEELNMSTTGDIHYPVKEKQEPTQEELRESYYAQIIRDEFRQHYKVLLKPLPKPYARGYNQSIDVKFPRPGKIAVTVTERAPGKMGKKRWKDGKVIRKEVWKCEFCLYSYEFRFSNGKQELEFRIPLEYFVKDPLNPTLEECRFMANGPTFASQESLNSYRELRALLPPDAIKVRYDELLYYIYQNSERLEKDGCIWNDPHEDPSNPTYSLPDLSSTSEKFGKWLAEKGVMEDPWDSCFYITRNKAALDEISFETNLIQEHYGSDAAERAGVEDRWEKWGLGGDDDVDYNGGYVDTAIDMLTDFINHEGR
jgi:hypothetical protein